MTVVIALDWHWWNALRQWRTGDGIESVGNMNTVGEGDSTLGFFYR